ncbi:MAG TPA: DEAD/DEAH box helicase family protein [Anaerolineae bacterium]|nr:DEAD/DEAH box helicase family protein [Anaerolineae bacterium]
MSNFAFLQAEWPGIHQDAKLAELFVRIDPRSACFYARRTLELAVHWLYEHDPAFQVAYDDNLAALMTHYSFRDNVPGHIQNKAHAIRQIGNTAVHSHSRVSKNTALSAIKELYHFLYWLGRTYTKGDPRAIPTTFDESKLTIPKKKTKPKTPGQLQKLEAKLKEQDEIRRQQEEALALQEATLAEKEATLAEKEALIAELQAELQAKIAETKAANQAIPDNHDYSEAETRALLIDLLLREVGWDPTATNVAEYKVAPMPNKSGFGKADYVLWDDNGLPLAVIEAKRATKDPQNGQQQAKLYADALEQMHGQRPIIFYTNGYMSWLWDDARQYPPRLVQGFYTKEELQYLIRQRSIAQPVTEMPINTAIVDRHYQKAAITHITTRFQERYRRALAVMATGTGKTRTTIALVDILMRANWIKRVLFLADRSALVNQAANAFKRHLPDVNPLNLLSADNKYDRHKERVIVSTYQTMINLIDKTDENGQKLFSVGHFDLIIIDEAHRSVYHKFGAIFDYFDSLLLGLTATPKDEVDRNTYRLFALEDGVPTYAYDLEEAVADGYLVPPNPKSVPVRFVREGIRYDELSDAEKAEWDLLEWAEGEAPEAIDAQAINSWLFNQNTVDQVLQHLMEHGLKVKGGDRLGKTIIFAKNHKHADFIYQRFMANYPRGGGEFARIIDNYQSYPQSLIDDFSQADSAPHIAISVDMLDTGIDVPEIVNLVFFKVIRSKTKFFQMIGRGTRLRPDLFGPDQDKEFFFVFDYCQNFEFFNQNPEGIKTKLVEPLSQRIFKHRLELIEYSQKQQGSQPELVPWHQGQIAQLHKIVSSINVNNFIVRPHRQYVDPYQDIDRWQNLSKSDLADLSQHVSGLPTQMPEDEETAKRFDLLILQLQLAHINQAPQFSRLRDRVITIADQLTGKTAIPMVKREVELLQAVQTDDYWQATTLLTLEQLRERLRELTQFIDRREQKIFYTDFHDQLGEMSDAPDIVYTADGVNLVQYRKKVEQFVRDRQNHTVINKIKHGKRLNGADLKMLEAFFFEAEETGSREEFARAYPEQVQLPAFIRSLVGLDRQAAKERFGEFLDSSRYTADQISFVNFIIDHLMQNGVMDIGLLYERPFTDFHYEGLSGVFAGEEAGALVAVVREINESVKPLN